MFSRAKQKKVNTALSSLLLSKMLGKEPDTQRKGEKSKSINKAVKESERAAGKLQQSRLTPG